MSIDDGISVLPKHLRVLCGHDVDRHRIKEIRMRANDPLIIETLDEEKVFDYIVTPEDIKETLAYISGYSVYAYENELKQGFITIQGGNRVGICGKTVCESEHVSTIKNISSFNIRFANEIKGVSDSVMPYLYKDNDVLCSTLIISPPGKGKTTLLRDIVRNLSNGFGNHAGINVGVVDERSEIAAMRQGIIQNDLGIRCDVLDGCPKKEGMYMLLRSMNPALIAVDEIGTDDDVRAILYCQNCGCRLLASIHGDGYWQIRQKKSLSKLFEEECFERFIVLDSRKPPGTIEGVYDKEGKIL